MAWPLDEVLPIVVELELDGVWTDITSHCIRDPIVITRGREDWADDIDPSTCQLTLNNRDGRYSPRNPTGPYYGTLTRNTPIRVGIDNGATVDYRFTGELASLPQRWDASGNDVYVPITASGVLRRLGVGKEPATSALKSGVLNTSDLQAYWTCEDEPRAFRFASALPDGAPLDIRSGSPDLAESTAFDCSAPLPELNDSQWNGRVNGHAATGALHCRFLLHIPDTGAVDGQAILVIKTNGSAAKWELIYRDDATFNDGAMAVRVRDADENEIHLTIEQFDGPLAVINGVPLQMTVEMGQSGSDINFRLHMLPVGAASGRTTAQHTVTGATLGRAKHVIVNPKGGLDDVVVGHILVKSALVGQLENITELNAHIGEAAGRRLERLCSENDITFESVGDLDDTVLMGPQRPSPLVDLLRECADTDGGMLYEPRGSLGIGYRTRRSVENQTAALELVYDSAHLSEPFEPVDDDQQTRNDVTAKRDGGSSARAVKTSGPVSVAEPPDGVGRYSTEIAVNPATDLDLPDHAGWRLHLGTVDEARFPTIAVNRARAPFVADSALSAAALDLDVGDVVSVENLPAWLPPDTVAQVVQGYREQLSQFEHSIEWNCTPASPWDVAVWPSDGAGGDDEVGSPWARFGPVNTTLAEDLTTTETGVDISTGGDTWTTSAADFPFDIVVGGEQMTVTANSGTTLTVTRSVNGVVKTHSTGATVRFAHPAIRPL